MKALLLALACLYLPSSAQAVTWYVAKGGNNANGCTNSRTVNANGAPTAPLLTIGAAVACLNAAASNQLREISVRAGTYVESLGYELESGESWTNVVRITRFRSELVTLRPTVGNHVVNFAGNPNGYGEQKYIEIDGINIDGRGLTTCSVCDVIKLETGELGGLTWDAHHIRFKNLTIWGNLTGLGQVILAGAYNDPATGLGCPCTGFIEMQRVQILGNRQSPNDPNDFTSMIYMQLPDFLFEDSLIDGIVGAGIQLYSQTTAPHRARILRNVFRNSAHPGGRNHCLNTIADDVQIINNVCWNISGSTLTPTGVGGFLIQSGRRHLIYNNTCVNAGNYCVILDSIGGVIEGSIIRNNIMRGSRAQNYLNDDGVGITFSNNHTNDGINPNFVNEAAGDFRLTASSACCDDNGMNLSAVFTTDHAGVTRTAPWSMGAFELTGSVPPLGPPLPVIQPRLKAVVEGGGLLGVVSVLMWRRRL